MTAEKALVQISGKSYTLPFALDGQQTVRIGINFSKETRNIEKAVVGILLFIMAVIIMAIIFTIVVRTYFE